jgi:hypothetical protein
LQKDYFN